MMKMYSRENETSWGDQVHFFQKVTLSQCRKVGIILVYVLVGVGEEEELSW